MYVCLRVCLCVCVCAISVYDMHALLKLCDAPLQVVDSYYYLHYNRSNYINCADENRCYVKCDILFMWLIDYSSMYKKNSKLIKQYT